MTLMTKVNEGYQQFIPTDC